MSNGLKSALGVAEDKLAADRESFKGVLARATADTKEMQLHVAKATEMIKEAKAIKLTTDTSNLRGIQAKDAAFKFREAANTKRRPILTSAMAKVVTALDIATSFNKSAAGNWYRGNPDRLNNTKIAPKADHDMVIMGTQKAANQADALKAQLKAMIDDTYK